MGQILVVTAVSCFVTRFDTVNIGFLLLMFLFFIFNFRQIRFKFDYKLNQFFHFKGIIYILIFYLLFFFLQFFLVINLANNTISLPFNDMLYYCDIQAYIQHFGIETLNLNPIVSQQDNVFSSAYHYFFIWNNFSNTIINNQPPVLNFLFYTLPFYQSLLIVGVAEVLKLIGKKKIYFCVILIFIAGNIYPVSCFFKNVVLFNTYDKWYFYENYVAGISILKPICYAVFIIAIHLSRVKQNIFLILFFLCALSIVSVSNAPVAGLSGFLWLIACCIKKRSILYKEFVFFFAGLAWVYSFYYFKPAYIAQPSVVNSVMSFFQAKQIYSSIIISAELILKGMLLYSAWIIIIILLFAFTKKGELGVLYNKIKNDYLIYLLYILILFSALSSWVVFIDVFGSKEIVIGIYMVIIKLGVFTLIIYFLTRMRFVWSSAVNKYLLFLILMLSIYMSYSTIKWQYDQAKFDIRFIDSFNDKIHSDHPVCFFYESNKKADTSDYMRTLLLVNPYYRCTDNSILLNKNAFNFIRLDFENYISMTDTGSYRDKAISMHPFIRYYIDHINVPLEKVKLLFIKENKINFGVFAKNVSIPLYLRSFIKNDYFDNVSGEHIIEIDTCKIRELE